MSGGSMNYLYSKIEYDGIESMEANTPERRAFKKHLIKVAKALHDIEWVDSGDYGLGDEVDAIMDCISPEHVVAELIEEAKAVSANLATWTKKLKEKGE